MRRGRFDSVHVGHLDVGDDQVGASGSAQLHQLAAVSGDGDHLVAQEREDLLEVVAHVELVVGDGDLERTGHGVPRGRVMMKTAPGPSASPIAIWPAVGLDDSLGDGQAQAGPLGLGGVERVEDLRSLLAGDPRAVVAHGDLQGGLAVELGRGGADLDGDGCRAGGQGVVEDIAKHLVEAERVDGAAQVRRHRAIRGAWPACPCGPARGGPRLRARSCPDRSGVFSSLIGAA